MKLEPPNDVDALCVALDIGLKRRARLSDEMGEGFIPWLQEMWLWARAQDSDNFLHVNPGFGKSDYTDNPGKAARTADGSPEWAPPSDEIGQYRASRDARDKRQAERLEEMKDLLGAMAELRAAINAMPRTQQRGYGRAFWILRSRLDAAERDLLRRMAA